MEVSVRHAATGRVCVVDVSEDDTVRSLKAKALESLFNTAAGLHAPRLALRVVASDGDADESHHLEDTDPIRNTALEGGGTAELMPHDWAEVACPATYTTSDDIHREFNDPAVHGVSVSPCGGFCAVSFVASTFSDLQAAVAVYDTPTGARLQEIPGAGGALFSPSGLWMAANCDGFLSLFDTAPHTPPAAGGCNAAEAGLWVCRVANHSARLPAIANYAWSPCERRIVVAMPTHLQVWHVGAAGIMEAGPLLRGDGRTIGAVAVTSRNVLNSIGAEVWMWSSDGECERKIHGHAGHVTGISASSAGFATCGGDGTVRLYSLEGEAGRVLSAFHEGHCNLSLSSEHSLVASVACNPGLGVSTLRVCDTESGRVLGEVSNEVDEWAPDPSYAVALSPCGRWVFANCLDSVRVADTSNLRSFVPPLPC